MRLSCILIGLCFTILSFAQDKQSASPFNDTLAALKKNNDAENYTYAFVDQYLKNPTEKQLALFDRYEKTMWRSLHSTEEQLAHVILLCNKGYYLNHFSNIYKSIEAYEKAWAIYKNHSLKGFDIIEYCLIPLGNNYTIVGDYTNAANIVKNYLYQSEHEKNNDHTLSAFINLSIIYHSTGKYDDAIEVLQQALSVKKISPDKRGLVYSNLATNYASLNDLPHAKRYAQRAITSLNEKADQQSLVNIYMLLSTISTKENDIENAVDYIKKAEAIVIQSPAKVKTRERAKLINHVAWLLKIKKDYNGAVKEYHKAFTILLPNYKGYDLPDTTDFYAENTIKETLDGLAEVYVNLHQEGMALRCYNLAFNVEDLLRETYNYDDARLLQQIENRNRTEDAIDILYARTNATKDMQDIVRAFVLAERTKAITLKEKIEERYAQTYVDHELIKQESDLRYKQATLATEIVVEQLKHQQADVAHIHDLIDEQNNTVLQLRNVQKIMNKKYPRYKDSNTTFNIDELNALQEKLTSDNACLVEYFSGRNAIYIFTIHAQTITLKKIDSVQTTKNDILELHDLFSEPSAINNNLDRYKCLSFKLSSLLGVSSIATKNLIIVPDGLLHVIPFDALLYEQAKGNQYTTFPYLLNKHTLSYQASADLYLNQIAEPSSSENKILAMFPVFKNTNQELAYSTKEANGIREYIDGKYLYESEATRKSFLEDVSHFNIIHLSTHASSGNGIEPPSISFIDSTLYLPQIYGMQIHADLIVLSACETGKGLLIKGEGAMSLARGFQFAGVNNIIFSLWKVNDYSTATLMTNFYANYASTMMKADALRQAKLDYLSDKEISNNHKSPYYWGGFIYYGSIDKQVNENRINGYLVIGGVILIILLLWIIYWRIRQARNKKHA